MNNNNVPWDDTPRHIRHVTYQIGNTIYSTTFVDESPIHQQNE